MKILSFEILTHFLQILNILSSCSILFSDDKASTLHKQALPSGSLAGTETKKSTHQFHSTKEHLREFAQKWKCKDPVGTVDSMSLR